MSRSLSFRADRVYEVTGLWVKPGQMDALMAYFSEVFPIARDDYGVRPLFGLEPLRAYAGDFTPDVMFVNEWPSLEAFQSFVADPRAEARFGARDAALERLVVTHYATDGDHAVALTDGDVVEFNAMWITPGREAELQRYYGTVFPIAQRHGLRPLTGLRPVFGYRGDFEPSRAGLLWWGETAAFDAFITEIAPHVPARDAALDRLEVMHARVRFEGGEG